MTDNPAAVPAHGELLATCQGLPLSEADRAAVVALSLNPHYLAYLATIDPSNPFQFPRIRELAAAVFYCGGDAIAVDLH